MNTATDASTTTDDALSNDILHVESHLTELYDAKLGTINAFASLVAGDLRREFDAFNESRALKRTFDEWVEGRPADELISQRAATFIKATMPSFSLTDIQKLEDVLMDALEANGILPVSEEGQGIMYTIGLGIPLVEY